MTNFGSWCDGPTRTPINGHVADVFVSLDDEAGYAAVATTLPHRYFTSEHLAQVAEALGKKKATTYIRKHFPTRQNAKSGDIGEILGTAYVTEQVGFVTGPSKLIHRDHQDWAMRGDDVLGAKFDSKESVQLVKVESKSQAKMTAATVSKARDGLERNDGMPNPHSLTQFASRLAGTADEDLGRAITSLQADEGIRPKRVLHVMFLFTGTDPSTHVEDDLEAYGGPYSQKTVTVRVNDHQAFIKSSYAAASF